MARLTANSGLSPRKQPKQQRSIATVGILLDAAAQVLAQHGFEGFTTNAIAERAGLSIGSCYQYFPSKEAVLAALIARESAQLVEGLQQAAGAPGWQAGIEAAIAAAVAHQMRQPRLALLLDIAEYVLPLDATQPGAGALACTVVAGLLARDDAPRVTDVAQASADVVALAHGMIDSAGKRGETDAASLGRRVAKAVRGYLATD